MNGKTLSWFQNEYEKILHSGLSDSQKGREYGELMTEMERTYQIPAIKNHTWEKENRVVIALYRKLAKSRIL